MDARPGETVGHDAEAHIYAVANRRQVSTCTCNFESTDPKLGVGGWQLWLFFMTLTDE